VAQQRSKPHKSRPSPKSAAVASAVVPRLLRRTEAARFLGLSPAALDLLRARGDIVPVPVPSLRRVGMLLRVPLYDVEDLHALIDRWKQDGGVS
jgi:hypothetical protein